MHAGRYRHGVINASGNLEAVMEVANARRLMVATQFVRASAGVKMCVRQGVQVIGLSRPPCR